MNDERYKKSHKQNINKNSNNKNNFKKYKKQQQSDHNIAEVAKNSLKNVLNGANNKEAFVAAAKFLNATKAFHFSPPPPLPPPSTSTPPPPSSSPLQTQVQHFIRNKRNTSNFDFEEETAINATAAGVQSNLQHTALVVNNGLSSLSTRAATADKSSSTTTTTATTRSIYSMAAIATTPIVHVGGGGSGGGGIDADIKMATDCEVIDYTINNIKNHNTNNNNNNNNNNNTTSRNNCDSRNSDHDRQQYGGLYGGRLQFFKDGKFILELARSKDGEKSGWVSVPRKAMRPPSATSSTITPTSATSLVAYPKNESSTSLSCK